MCNSNDIPVTRAEERELYGEEVTEQDMQIAFARQLKAIDTNDVAYFCDEFNEPICNAFHSGDKLQIGEIIYKGLRALAQSRANIELYGTSKQREPILRGTLADLGKLTIRGQA